MDILITLLHGFYIGGNESHGMGKGNKQEEQNSERRFYNLGLSLYFFSNFTLVGFGLGLEKRVWFIRGGEVSWGFD